MSLKNLTWSAFLWLITLFFCLLVLLIVGCTEHLTPQPQIHPIAGNSVMFVPEGCRIGDMKAPEDGVYIGESKLIEGMRRQREEEKRKRQGRT